ncbi:MAG: hypothetical protein U0894_17390 [Pirellulales bacterium]
MNTPPSSSSSAAPVAGHGTHSILWLLGAIVCGVLLGASYGQSMWLSSDEPGSHQAIDEALRAKSFEAASRRTGARRMTSLWPRPKS